MLVALRVIVVVLELVLLYQRYRLGLWWWKRRSVHAFSQSIRGLPPELRRELEREYGVFLRKKVRLPGLLVFSRMLGKWRLMVWDRESHGGGRLGGGSESRGEEGVGQAG